MWLARVWPPALPGSLATQVPRFHLGTLPLSRELRHLRAKFGAMGWWFLALMLVLVPWHTRNPTLWLWVLMSCLPEVDPCLLCFGPPIQRARLCRDITGAFVDELRHKKCMEALVEAAKPLASVTVGTS